jgi:mono/diheme cytochrome c family protein
MLNKKSLVILAGLLTIAALMLLLSWSPATVTAQGPAPTPQPPVAVLKVVNIAGVVTDPNAITATIKIISDTAVGPANATIAMATTGGSNVPINVPVILQVSAADPKNSGTATWSLTKPSDSKATITGTLTAKFTPDVVGAYYVQVTLKNTAGVTSAPQFAFFNAGTYVGVYTGNCKQCHPEQTTEWAKTGHAQVFPLELDNKIDGPRGIQQNAQGYITHYSETCVACHATGFYAAPFNGSGGYFDAKAKANWTFPTWKQIDEVFTKKAPSNFDAAPQGVKDMGTIGCETCHGPAGQHVKGAKVMDANWDSGVCDQCHGTRGGHTRGVQLGFSAHSDESAHAWEIAGPEEQGCVRCHTAKGYASFLKNPKNQAAWNNEASTLTCAGCHDPHSEANAFQLRVVGKPVELPFAVKREVGLSATCYECHNGRRNGDDFAAGKTTSYPHYSNAAEMMEDTGGITYGATVPNSPHGAMVGAAPVPNPAYDAKNAESAKFMFSPIGDDKGNTPGSCVVCHMAAAITTANDPLQYKVGGHSFNTVTPDGKTDYGASCKSCHGDVKDFNLKAKADYDGNGKVEGVQDEVKGLLQVVWKQLEAKGFKKVETGNPYAQIPADADQKAKNAWFNFRYVYGVMWGPETGNGNEGKAAAVHNFKRSVTLLQLSIKDLTGSLPAGAAEMK